MRRGTTLTLLIFIILLAAGAAFVDFWPGGNGLTYHGVTVKNPFTIQQGLDLQGGTEIQLIPKSGNPSDSDMQTTADQIAKRLSGANGVQEPNVRLQQVGTSKSIVVELPKFGGDQQDVLQNITKTGKLEFWISPQAETVGQPYQGTGNAPFNGNDLDPNGLSVGQDPNTGSYLIQFTMKGGSAQRFGTFTSNNVGNTMTVTLDGTVVTSATIQSAITSNGQITGNFTKEQATDTVNLLKYGALPVALTQVSEQTIGSTLGSDTIERSLLAGAIGLGIVVLFMLFYYRLPGLLADLALVLYSLITFAIFKMIGVTLSLAGIAGFILSIGMAVDANVLIFERVKEELRAGRILSSAIDIGWKRAWPSIRDSNTSTMITCAVLYFFGSNFGATMIVGFATTLFLGVVVSMFTAIVVTRTFLNLLVPTGVINHPALFGLPANAIPATTGSARRSRAV